MIIQLPLENWADLLPFVPRHQLVEIVKQLNDRQFAKILQFFLTEVGQITLGHLRILEPRGNDPNPNGGGPIVEVRKQFWSAGKVPPPTDLETNLPDGPMPNNVKDFKLIEFSYFDESVANFLRQFHQNEEQQQLLDNVNLWFPSTLSLMDRNRYMPYLAQLMPMIGNININSMSMSSLCYMGFGCAGSEPNNAASHSQLLTTMLTNARILEIHENMHFNMFPWCDWLYTPRYDGKPRELRLRYGSFPDTKNLVEQIKKDFSKAIRPISFFVYVCAFWEDGNVHWQDICLDNGQNERLVVKTIDPPTPNDFWKLPDFWFEKLVLISRYPMEANQQGWIEANEKETIQWKFDDQNRQIRFDYISLDGTKW